MSTKIIKLVLPCLIGLATACTTQDRSALREDPVVAQEPTGPIVSEYAAGTCDQVAPAIKNSIIDDFRIEGVSMFGCTEPFPDDPTRCLSQFPERTDWADQSQVQGHTVRQLRALSSSTAFWLRTSADGRYVATGNGTIHDLKVDDRRISVEDVSIDPVFAPDNQWYAWIGIICKQKNLANLDITSVGSGIEGSACTSNSFNDYASIGFGDDGQFLVPTNYSSTNFGSASGQDSFLGGDFATQNPLQIRIVKNFDLTGEVFDYRMTGEEDYLIGPSGQLMVGRLVDEEFDGEQRGYRVRMVRPDGQNLNPTDNSNLATICLKGEKPNISFDNRFVTFHHYTEQLADQSAGSNPREVTQDQDANPRAGNIFIYDLKKSKGYRVTNMPQGSSALFPHFRADGWLIFQVKQENGDEYVAATNAAAVVRLADALEPALEAVPQLEQQPNNGRNPQQQGE